jgi:hypothetical protein
LAHLTVHNVLRFREMQNSRNYQTIYLPTRPRLWTYPGRACQRCRSSGRGVLGRHVPACLSFGGAAEGTSRGLAGLNPTESVQLEAIGGNVGATPRVGLFQQPRALQGDSLAPEPAAALEIGLVVTVREELKDK